VLVEIIFLRSKFDANSPVKETVQELYKKIEAKGHMG
jgi:hypothetical protein